MQLQISKSRPGYMDRQSASTLYPVWLIRDRRYVDYLIQVSNVVCVLLCILSAAGIAGNMITHLYMREYKTWLSKSILCSDR